MSGRSLIIETRHLFSKLSEFTKKFSKKHVTMMHTFVEDFASTGVPNLFQIFTKTYVIPSMHDKLSLFLSDAFNHVYLDDEQVMMITGIAGLIVLIFIIIIVILVLIMKRRRRRGEWNVFCKRSRASQTWICYFTFVRLFLHIESWPSCLQRKPYIKDGNI